MQDLENAQLQLLLNPLQHFHVRDLRVDDDETTISLQALREKQRLRRARYHRLESIGPNLHDRVAGADQRERKERPYQRRQSKRPVVPRHQFSHTRRAQQGIIGPFAWCPRMEIAH